MTPPSPLQAPAAEPPSPSGLLISLSPDHQSFTIETPAGTHPQVPLTLPGLALLRNLLIEQKRGEVRRALANRQELVLDKNRRLADAMALGVGTEASPTQHDVDRWVESQGREPFITILPQARSAKRHGLKPRTVSLEDLGL